MRLLEAAPGRAGGPRPPFEPRWRRRLPVGGAGQRRRARRFLPPPDGIVSPAFSSTGLKHPLAAERSVHKGTLPNPEDKDMKQTILARVKVREATLAPPVFGIRHVPELERGAPNPDFPGLFVFFDTDPITPSTFKPYERSVSC